MNHEVYFVSKTDKGLIVDVVVPGYATEDFKVVSYVDGTGDCAVNMIRVSGKYTRPHGETGKLVPRFAFEKVVSEKIKLELPIEDTYDMAKLKWAVKNGVLRIRIGKTEAAIGKTVAAVADVETGEDTEE